MAILPIKFYRWFEFNYKIINYYIAAEKWTQFRELYPQENSHFYYFLWAIFHFPEINIYWKTKNKERTGLNQYCFSAQNGKTARASSLALALPAPRPGPASRAGAHARLG